MIAKKHKLTKFVSATVIVVLTGLSGFFLALTGPTYPIDAQTRDEVCEGVEFTGGSCEGDAEGTLSGVVQDFLNIFSAIIGIIAVIFVLYGGFRYVTSAGDAGKIAAAQSTIVYGLVGIVVAALAQVLVRFVLSQVT